jgi:hypothetical protein
MVSPEAIKLTALEVIQQPHFMRRPNRIVMNAVEFEENGTVTRQPSLSLHTDQFFPLDVERDAHS